MGSFWGHVDEGLFFILLAVWWMLNAFRDYILAESKGMVMRPNIHYDVTVCKHPLPVEIVLKTLFPLVGFLAEVIEGHFEFHDDKRNFINLTNQQHMTIYGIFIIHGVTDLMDWFRVPVFPGFNYMTGFLAFLWYGTIFYYHATMHGKEPVETLVHILPIYILVMIATAYILEIKWKEGVWTTVVRSYGVLTLGTWFSHVAFMLYVSDRFPGPEPSDLDRSDHNNVTYVKAMFGLHLLGNLVFSVVLYLAVYVVLTIRLGIYIKMPKYGKVPESYNVASRSHCLKPQRRKKQETGMEDSSILLENEQSA